MINRSGEMGDPYLFMGTYQIGQKKQAQRLLVSALQQGIRAFDTAPSYGTEQILGEALQQGIKKFSINRNEIIIADKIDAWQMQAYEEKIEVVIKAQLQKLQVDYIDLLLIHWPFQKYFDRVWAGMLQMKRAQLIRQVGVCNVNTRIFHELFDYRSLEEQPDVIQVERHPYNTCDDLIQLAKERKITVQAYSPICRMKFDKKDISMLNKIGEKYEKTVGQVILRWHIDTGVVPIVKTSNEKRIAENQDILNFSLNKEEIICINTLNRNYKLFPESWGCPGI